MPLSQSAFGPDHPFADNPDPRCPLVLLLDTSTSMSGDSIRQLNEGLRCFAEELRSDTIAKRRVEIAVVTFGGIPIVLNEFSEAHNFFPVDLTTQGATPMGAAINLGLDLLDARKSVYKQHGIKYYRPWVFLITDGEPTDDWKQAAERIRSTETRDGLALFAIGVREANMATLAKIAVRDPLKLDGLKFRELFLWLSASLKSVSRSTPGALVPLEDPRSGPRGWAAV